MIYLPIVVVKRRSIVAVQTWEEFNREYELIKKFGLNALQDKLNQQLKVQGQTTQLSKNDVLNALSQVINTPEIHTFLNKTENQQYLVGLSQVDKSLRQNQVPRAEPSVEIKANLENRQAQQRFKTAEWTKSFEPAIQEVAAQMAAALNQNPKQGAAIVSQYEKVLSDSLRQQAELRLKMKMPAPAPSKRQKPEPY